MKAIVTGADGFIGSALISNLLDHDVPVLGIDLFDKPRRLVLDNPFLKYVSMSLEDIQKLGALVKKGEYDVFYHFAWRGSGGDERGNVDIQFENVRLSISALKEAVALGCKKFVFVSSVVELEENKLAYEDDTKPDPHYIYGGAKGACHSLLKPLANQLGIELVWANISGVYGIGDTTPNFINSVLKKIDLNEPLQFTEGRQYFDFVYIDDVAEAFRLLGENGKANRSYVIGSGHAASIRSFVETILSVLGVKKEVCFGAIPYSGLYLSEDFFDIQKLKMDCGFSPKTSFSEGIIKTHNWLNQGKMRE